MLHKRQVREVGKIIFGFRKICWATVHLFNQFAATCFYVFFLNDKILRCYQPHLCKEAFSNFLKRSNQLKIAGDFPRQIIHVRKWKSPTVNNEQWILLLKSLLLSLLLLLSLKLLKIYKVSPSRPILLIILSLSLQLLKVIKVGSEALLSTCVTITINEDRQFTAQMVSECVTNKRYVVLLCISNIGVCQC